MSDEPVPKNKGGRPRKYPGEGRRPTLSLRVRGGLYEKLQKASEVSQRTVSEEMERRLENSFDHESTADALQAQYFRNLKMMFGGSEGLDAAVALGRTWFRAHSIADHQFGEEISWIDSAEKRKCIEDNFNNLLVKVFNGLHFNAKTERDERNTHKF